MSVEHWEDYYRGGAIATCPMGPTANYTLELRDVWLDYFSALPNGARVLDIGTGNGAVALFAMEAAATVGKRFEVHGADLATIDPVRHVPGGSTLYAGIKFHAGMPAENLLFESGSFDAVSGQYALEYTHIGSALVQVYRVLKPGGRAQFVLHHAASALLRNAAESLAHCDLVLHETRILGRLRRLAEAEKKSSSAARSAAAEIAAATARLREAAATSATPHVLHVVLDAMEKLLGARRQASPALFDREVSRFEREVRSGMRRLRDLQACALSAEQVRGLAGLAQATGFDCPVVAEQFHAESTLVGWRMQLQVPAETG